LVHFSPFWYFVPRKIWQPWYVDQDMKRILRFSRRSRESLELRVSTAASKNRPLAPAMYVWISYICMYLPPPTPTTAVICTRREEYGFEGRVNLQSWRTKHVCRTSV
jgi:hypothetical protein